MILKTSPQKSVSENGVKARREDLPSDTEDPSAFTDTAKSLLLAEKNCRTWALLARLKTKEFI